ncbi:MAG: nucleotide exchange factor GrpE [Verrucomicrobiales bacterium]|jgi:molecular chaperone GrpE|nr:nucleotide exchange factor GrpE [Verrucomicrobiales bacterium]
MKTESNPPADLDPQKQPAADQEPPTTPGANIEQDLAREVNQLAELTKTVAAMQDKLLRTQADFDNYRKRMAREKDEAVKYANTDLLETLLPVIDNFELGLQAAESAADAKSILQGMRMVKAQLQRFLADNGVVEMESVGQKFDPHLHEALSQQESADHEDGVILSQQRKGYKLKDRLLRPAAVIVAHKPAAEK